MEYMTYKIHEMHQIGQFFIDQLQCSSYSLILKKSIFQNFKKFLADYVCHHIVWKLKLADGQGLIVFPLKTENAEHVI